MDATAAAHGSDPRATHARKIRAHTMRCHGKGQNRRENDPGPNIRGPKAGAGVEAEVGAGSGTPRRSGRVLIIESWVNGGAPMSALEPTPVPNPRIWALPDVARRGHSEYLSEASGLLLPNQSGGACYIVEWPP